MAIRFAKQAGNWSDPNTWEDGLTIPTTGDQVFLNSYNVTIDQNVTVESISNSTTFVGLPGSIIPNMTSNTSPTGVGQAFSTRDSADAWIPFAKDFVAPSGNWNAGAFSGDLGFQFDTPKNIQRYSWSQSYTQAAPRIWTFEASNDGVSWTIIHTVSTNYSGGSYYSPVISNPSSYTYYRINVGGVQGSQYLGIVLFDMTESTSLTKKCKKTLFLEIGTGWKNFLLNP